MILLEGLLTILVLGAIGFYGACAWFTVKFFTTPESSESTINPPVSILVPICGLDAGAWKNWTSLCEQDYPDYQVLFGVVEDSDPAVPTLERLVQKYPHAHCFVGLSPRGINHKDSTLSYLLEQTTAEIIIFADSDIRVAADYIRTVIPPLVQPVPTSERSANHPSTPPNDPTAVVTCAYIAHQPQFLGSALASLGRCCEFIPSALIAQALDGGLKFAIGVTIATRRTLLADYGGLQLNRIGSDYNLGQRAAAAGYRVQLSSLVLESDTGQESLAQVFERELRWARTIRCNRGWVYYTMIFCYGTVLCWLLLGITHGATWAIALTAITWTVRYIQAAIAALSMKAPRLLTWFWLLPLRDSFSFCVWLMGAWGRQVRWRGRRLRIEGDGIIQAIGP